MKKARDVLQLAMAQPKAHFGQLALTFNKADDATFSQVGQALAMMDDALNFWRGDYLVAYKGHVQKRCGAAGVSQPVAEKQGREAIHEVLSTQTDDPQRWLQAMRLCEFFPPETRRKISSRHHLEAMCAAEDDPLKGQQWLDIALEEKLTVIDLRARARKQRAIYTPDNREKTGNGYSSFLACTSWIRCQMNESITSAQASAMLVDFADHIFAANMLRSRLVELSNALKQD